jgi:hypothetical protein
VIALTVDGWLAPVVVKHNWWRCLVADPPTALGVQKSIVCLPDMRRSPCLRAQCRQHTRLGLSSPRVLLVDCCWWTRHAGRRATRAARHRAVLWAVSCACRRLSPRRACCARGMLWVVWCELSMCRSSPCPCAARRRAACAAYRRGHACCSSGHRDVTAPSVLCSSLLRAVSCKARRAVSCKACCCAARRQNQLIVELIVELIIAYSRAYSSL